MRRRTWRAVARRPTPGTKGAPWRARRSCTRQWSGTSTPRRWSHSGNLRPGPSGVSSALLLGRSRSNFTRAARVWPCCATDRTSMSLAALIALPSSSSSLLRFTRTSSLHDISASARNGSTMAWRSCVWVVAWARRRWASAGAEDRFGGGGGAAAPAAGQAGAAPGAPQAQSHTGATSVACQSPSAGVPPRSASATACSARAARPRRPGTGGRCARCRSRRRS
ncbi:hypothetical protein FQZ97_873730 [compost metagenome]